LPDVWRRALGLRELAALRAARARAADHASLTRLLTSEDELVLGELRVDEHPIAERAGERRHGTELELR